MIFLISFPKTLRSLVQLQLYALWVGAMYAQTFKITHWQLKILIFFISTDGQNGSGKCGHVFTNRTRQKRTIGAHRISCVHACIAVRTVLIPLTVKTNSAI